MKSKNYVLWGLALALLFSLNACKPKESAYKAAYEAAKAREVPDNSVVELTPVTGNPALSSGDAVQREKVTAVDGAGILQYSVVVGSYQNKTNAESLKNRMANEGYKSFLAQNERGLYRVIIATFGDRASAAAERDRFKNKHPENEDFQAAWLLDNR